MFAGRIAIQPRMLQSVESCGKSVGKGRSPVSAVPSQEVSRMLRSRDAYVPEEELYVYDQCCENCIYYCNWDEDEENGCKNYDRPDYEKHPAGGWCCDWRGKRP